MRERLHWRLHGVLACFVLAGCAHAPGREAARARPAAKPPAASTPLEALLAWLPRDAVLVGRVDVRALDELGFAEPLVGDWIGRERAPALLDGAQQALLALVPAREDPRDPDKPTTTRVVILRQGAPPRADPQIAWSEIAHGAWLGCVQGCEGFASESVAVQGAKDLRAMLSRQQAQEIATVHAAIPRDASHEALRSQWVDGPISVVSDLDVASLRIAKRGEQIAIELMARFATPGVASNAALAVQGALGQIADELEAGGLVQEADQLMAALRIELKSAMTSAGAQEKAELHARLDVPVLSLPALALAWNKSQDAED